MKLADDFLEVCLNYDNEVQRVLKELKENDALNFLGRNAEHIILKNRMFVVEEEDFNKMFKEEKKPELLDKKDDNPKKVNL